MFSSDALRVRMKEFAVRVTGTVADDYVVAREQLVAIDRGEKMGRTDDMLTSGQARIVEIVCYELARYSSLVETACAFEVLKTFLAKICVREDKDCICSAGSEEGVEECNQLVIQLTVSGCVEEKACVYAKICGRKVWSGERKGKEGGGCAGSVKVERGRGEMVKKEQEEGKEEEDVGGYGRREKGLETREARTRGE